MTIDHDALGATPRQAVFLVAVGSVLTVYRPDTQRGTLHRLGEHVLPEAVQYAWAHPARPLVYVAFSNRYTTPDGNRHGLMALCVDGATGRLLPLGDPVPLGNRPVSITVSDDGRFLFVACNLPSDIGIHALAPDGTPGPAIPQLRVPDAGIYAHQVRVMPQGHAVLLSTRGNDATASAPEAPGALRVFGFEAGQLHALQSVAPGGGIGFGPRHVDFHPSRPWMYVCVERQNQLQMFAIDNGRVAPAAAFTTSTLAASTGPGRQQLAGAIHVSADGRFVYVSNRADATTDFRGEAVFAGGENSIAVFAIDPATGEPTLVQSVPTGSFHCRTFSIHPDGTLLVSAAVAPMKVRVAERVVTVGAALSVFHIGPDGLLRRVRKYDVDTGDGWMFWCAMVPFQA